MTYDPTLSWVRHHLGREAEIGAAPLGGVTSRVHLVRAGERRAVLKQVTNKRWLAERDDVIAYEARVLHLLKTTAVPVPEVLAIAATGEFAGFPVMLLSWIDGIPAGETTDEWLDPLVDVAVEISRVNPEPWVRPFSRYLKSSVAKPPESSENPSAWQRAIDIVSEPAPPSPVRFIHRDLHPWNVLWNRVLVGVVDWSQASVGPTTMDAAHCRANLAIGLDMEAADRFRRRWQSATGFTLDPYWDLVTCVDFLSDRRPSARGDSRLDAWVERLVAESGR